MPSLPNNCDCVKRNANYSLTVWFKTKMTKQVKENMKSKVWLNYTTLTKTVLWKHVTRKPFIFIDSNCSRPTRYLYAHLNQLTLSLCLCLAFRFELELLWLSLLCGPCYLGFKKCLLNFSVLNFMFTLFDNHYRLNFILKTVRYRLDDTAYELLL